MKRLESSWASHTSGLRINSEVMLDHLIGFGQKIKPPDGGLMMDPLIESHRTALKALASRHGLRSIRVFGSMARGGATSTSDVDLLVDYQQPVSGFSLGALLMDAQDLLGRKVDVVTVNSLHPMMRERVLRESQLL
jgi:uncharacterized protein